MQPFSFYISKIRKNTLKSDEKLVTLSLMKDTNYNDYKNLTNVDENLA